MTIDVKQLFIDHKYALQWEILRNSELSLIQKLFAYPLPNIFY